MMYRQGDVLLKRLDGDLPRQAVLREPDHGRVVLAYGEVTGHAHALDATHTALWSIGPRTFLCVEAETPLVHEEHAAIPIPPGVYEVVRQREYTLDGKVHYDDREDVHWTIGEGEWSYVED